MSRWNGIALSSSLAVSACSNPGGGMVETDSGSSTSGVVDSSSGGPNPMTSQSSTEQASVDGDSGDSTTMPVDPTTGDPTTGSTGPSDSTSSTGPDDTTSSGSGSSSGTSSGTSSSTTGDESSTGEPVCPAVGPAGLPGVNPNAIWISNSTQSTISKIDTGTLVELGRYATRPDLAGSPSRTSVSLDGDVAVANRSGGLTKYYGDPADCVDANGDGVITTSSGAADVLPWDQEECRAWYLPLAYISQRPVAWTFGTLDETSCERVGEQLWTSGSPDGAAVEVVLVDGETGIIEELIPIPGVNASYFGIYGAAVDSQGNFWGSQLGTGTLVNVDLQTLAVQTWPMAASGYGMTVDQEGYVWTCSYVAARFDPITETWIQANAGGSGGCMSDGGDILWMASSPLVGINRQTLVVEHSIALPEYVHGVSVDFQGYVWGVSMGNNAYRVDPATGTWDTVTGLVSPYTYSDMTGFALATVAP